RNRPLNCSCLMLLLVTSAIAVDVVKEYILVKENLTWPDAQNYCRTHHKDLVSIHSREEVKTLLGKYGNVSENSLWIGLEKNASKDQWMWSSGEPVNFTNWDETQPNNKGQREDCVVMEGPGKWHDYFCTSSQFYVCFNGSRSSGDLKYHFIKEKKNWFEAQDTCRENYTDLVSITSQQELWNITSITGGANVWIGLYQNPWQWSNGDESSFQYWDINEPNNIADNVCVGMWLKHKGDGHPSEVGKWDDFQCNTSHQHFLCYKAKFILVKENKSWFDAVQYCQEHYTDLVSVTSPELQMEVAEIARKSSGDRVWIGLSRDLLYQVWLWEDQNKFNYTNWGEGVQTYSLTNHCGFLDAHKNFTWGIHCCFSEFNFICYL
uniref:C-type lectin domain-containing protein n=1 Tax=Latimeria chalumnae TaxID=7897 RepID=H2ZT55_LATCH